MSKGAVLLFIAVITAASGQIFFKFGSINAGTSKPLYLILLEPLLILGLFCYFLSTLFYISALRSVPITVAYTSMACSYIIVMLAGHFLFLEPLTIKKVIGVLLIAAGVALI
jgi:drug/metabolite transporter (DMT)-like permease